MVYHSKKKNKTKLKRNIKKIFFIFFIFLFSIVMPFFLIINLDIFKIKDIQINGNTLIKQETIDQIIANNIHSKFFGLYNNNNLFLFPQKSIKKDILNKKEVFSVEISKSNYFRIINIEIKERIEKYYFCNLKKMKECYSMDEDGFIFYPKKEHEKKDKIIFFAEKKEDQYFNKKKFIKIKDFIEKIHEQLLVVEKVIYKEKEI